MVQHLEGSLKRGVDLLSVLGRSAAYNSDRRIVLLFWIVKKPISVTIDFIAVRWISCIRHVPAFFVFSSMFNVLLTSPTLLCQPSFLTRHLTNWISVIQGMIHPVWGASRLRSSVRHCLTWECQPPHLERLSTLPIDLRLQQVSRTSQWFIVQQYQHSYFNSQICNSSCCYSNILQTLLLFFNYVAASSANYFIEILCQLMVMVGGSNFW